MTKETFAAIAEREFPADVVEMLRNFNYTEEQFEELVEAHKIYGILTKNMRQVDTIFSGNPFCERNILAESSAYKDDLDKLDERLEFLKANQLIAGVQDSVNITGRPKKLVALLRNTAEGHKNLWTNFLYRVTNGRSNPNLKLLKEDIRKRRWLSRKNRTVYYPTVDLKEMQPVPDYAITAELNHFPSDMELLKRHWNEFYIEQDNHPLKCLCGREVLDYRKLPFPEQI